MLKEGAAGQKKLPSPEFSAWVGDSAKLKNLLEGSCVFTEPWDRRIAYEDWEKGRRFIASALDRSGTILDYGCANGFLLRSLQEWSNHDLEPYGFDIDERAIAKARELFPDRPDHFVGLADQGAATDFPREFDFVYWGVWDNWKFERPQEAGLFRELQSLTKEGGRLILGFYDTREETLRKIEQLKQLGFAPSGVLKNPDGEQALIWFDKSPSPTPRPVST